jgi:hypothetical protein
MTAHRLLVASLALLAVAGCGVTTRTARFGPFPDGTNLVTLVVTSDLDVVYRACHGVSAVRRAVAGDGEHVLGCQRSEPVWTQGSIPVRAVTVVRFAESLPSPVTFEIDAHELCHTVAALQLLSVDPCHAGNDGTLEALGANLRR